MGYPLSLTCYDAGFGRSTTSPCVVGSPVAVCSIQAEEEIAPMLRRNRSPRRCCRSEENTQATWLPFCARLLDRAALSRTGRGAETHRSVIFCSLSMSQSVPNDHNNRKRCRHCTADNCFFGFAGKETRFRPRRASKGKLIHKNLITLRLSASES